MSAQFIAVPAFDLVVFGGTGDLAMRKILPGLYHRHCDGQLPPESRIIGAARSALNRDAFVARVREALTQFVAAADLDAARVDSYLRRIDYVAVDVTADAGWSALAERLADTAERVRVFYLATAPNLFGPICQRLAGSGVLTPKTRVVLEKPLGHDLASAHAINDAVGAVFEEHQIFRIDHYLGKETVQNLMALRFANALFEPLWNRTAIDHVQITVAETIGVEGRAAYYDERRRVARHGAEPSAAAALPRRHGAAGGLDRRCGARREVEGAARADARSPTDRWQAAPRAGSIRRAPSAASRCPAISRSWAAPTPATPRPSWR